MRRRMVISGIRKQEEAAVLRVAIAEDFRPRRFSFARAWSVAEREGLIPKWMSYRSWATGRGTDSSVGSGAEWLYPAGFCGIQLAAVDPLVGAAYV
jgi:hypothetical protein